MAKNITIQEGLVARNFTGVKKLSTTQMNSSEKVSWIPEDEVLDYVTLKELKVTANGTYKAEDKNCDGFDKVKVEISADVVPQKVITANGEYDAAEETGKAGYAHVSVNVPGGGGGPYTVRFFDDNNNLIKTQENVPWGGYATCTELDGSIVNGLYFKGWNPVPKNVQANINCFPVRGDYQIVSGEILDDWETICADCGAHYPLGSYKTLVFDVPLATFSHSINHVYRASDGIYYDGCVAQSRNGGGNLTIGAKNFAMHMVKVAEGEDGSTSTWIADNVFEIWNNYDDMLYERFLLPDNTISEVRTGWADSIIRKWMNEHMITSMPAILQNTIKDVDKTYKANNLTPHVSLPYGYGVQQLDKTCVDKIWIPSLKETETLISTFSNYNYYEQVQELTGIDYSTVFASLALTGSAAVMFRSQGFPSNDQASGIYFINCSGLQLSKNRNQPMYSLFGFCL